MATNKERNDGDSRARRDPVPLNVEVLPREVEQIYEDARGTYLAWHILEGDRRAIIDYDLGLSSPFTNILRELANRPADRTLRGAVADKIFSLLESMEEVTPPASENHNWEFLKSQLKASFHYARRQITKRGTASLEYIENTMGISPAMIPDGILEGRQEIVYGLLQEIGITEPTVRGFLNWKAEHQLTKEEAGKLLESSGRSSLKKLGRFIGKDLEPNFVIVPIEQDAYFWAWADADPRTGLFRIRQNFFKPRGKIWTPGKVDEMGYHEIAGHTARMNERQKLIQQGRLNRVFGITTVHGPEAVVEEGFGQTVPFFIPGAYQSLSPEGRFQVEATIYRNMVYNNVHFMLHEQKLHDTRDIRRYVHKRIPWEPAREIDEQIIERVADPILETYAISYGAGALRALSYAYALNPEGRRILVEELYSRPYNSTQVAELCSRLLTNPEYQSRGYKKKAHVFQSSESETSNGISLAS